MINRLRRNVRALVVAIIIPVTACRPVCEGVGLCDPPARPPIDVYFLCDVGGGSPCDSSSLRAALRRVLPELNGREVSIVSVWKLGTDFATTSEVFRDTVEARGYPGSNAARRFFNNQIDSILQGAADAVLPTAAEIARRESPLAEGISKIAHTAQETRRAWSLFVLSDGLQETADYRFECAFRPSPDEFIAVLERKSLLGPGSLSNTKAAFLLHGEFDEIPSKCSTQSLERGLEIDRIWTAVLDRAGSTNTHVGVEMPPGPVLGRNEV